MKIFINYRREDASDAAFIIAKSLMARFGEANVFFDRQGIQAGENFIRTIESAFMDCRIFIPLIGREWNNILINRSVLGERDFVLEEISHAIDKGVGIIPVLLDDASIPVKKDLPEKLRAFSEIQGFFLSTDAKRLQFDLENLNTVVMKKLSDLAKPNQHPPSSPSSPSSPVSVPGPDNGLDYVADIDGNSYPVIAIGSQIWMAKNLAVTRYRNSDLIPKVNEDHEWKTIKTGACCSYENDSSNTDEYGLLYNWFAVSDLRSICPPGWHIPSRRELELLRTCSGDWKTTGGWLKEAGFTHWNQPNEGAVNKSGFTALPGGMRSKYGHFSGFGYRGRFWSSTLFGKFDESFSLFLIYDEAGASMFRDEMNSGFSVRCIKD